MTLSVSKNPHRFIMGEMLWPLAPLFLTGSSSFLQVLRTYINAGMIPDPSIYYGVICP